MSATREAPFDAPTLAEHLVSQQAKIFDRLECIMEDFSGRLIRAGQQITLVKARQQANDEKLNEERSLRVSLENQLEACQAELQRQKEELIDCKVWKLPNREHQSIFSQSCVVPWHHPS